jgi:hypothetical protein
VKFLADENMNKPIAERLGKDGYIVLYVAEIEPSISEEERREGTCQRSDPVSGRRRQLRPQRERYVPYLKRGLIVWM